MTKQIELTKGKVALVDDDIYEYLNQWEWHALFNNQKWYAQRMVGKRPFRKHVYMHRIIMNITNPKILVDHVDNDGLNNQRLNLRICSDNQNKYNRNKQGNNISGYKGVFWDSQKQKYHATIKANGVLIHLGFFDNPIDGAYAYDEAAKKYHGEFARTNF